MAVKVFNNEVLFLNPNTYQSSTSPNIWVNRKNIYTQGWDVNLVNDTNDKGLVLGNVPYIHQQLDSVLMNAFSDTDPKEITAMSINLYNFYSNARDLSVNLLDDTDIKFIAHYGSAGLNDKILAGDYSYTSHLVVFDINDNAVDICPNPHIPMHVYDGSQTIFITNTNTTYTLTTVPRDYLHELFILSNLPISIQALYVRAMNLEYPETQPALYYNVFFFVEGDTEWTNITLNPYNIISSPTPFDIYFKFYFGLTVQSLSGVKEKIALIFDVWFI